MYWGLGAGNDDVIMTLNVRYDLLKQMGPDMLAH